MQIRVQRALVALFVALAIAGCATPPPTPAAAVPSGPPQSLLWVGNSFFYYNNSMHGHVAQPVSYTHLTLPTKRIV